MVTILLTLKVDNNTNEPVVSSPVNSIFKSSITELSAPSTSLIVVFTNFLLGTPLMVNPVSMTNFLFVKSPNKRTSPALIGASSLMVPSSLK